jgi:hypothetical protein
MLSIGGARDAKSSRILKSRALKSHSKNNRKNKNIYSRQNLLTFDANAMPRLSRESIANDRGADRHICIGAILQRDGYFCIVRATRAMGAESSTDPGRLCLLHALQRNNMAREQQYTSGSVD